MDKELPERESVSVNVTFPKSFLEDELIPAYPSASRMTQAIRMACQDAVESRRANEQFVERVREALEEIEDSGDD